MKVTLESTDKTVEVNGVPARVWEGQTEKGVPCFALVTRIAVHRQDDAAEFERDLQETRPVSARVEAALPTRLVL